MAARYRRVTAASVTARIFKCTPVFRVISYRKMLRDAELRSRTFFDQLKLESPSAAVKMRSAKVRERRKGTDNVLES